MGHNAARSLGARGRQDAHLFFPQDLTLIVGPNCDAEVKALAKAGLLSIVEDTSHFLYDKRADMPIDRDLSESLVKDGPLQPIRIMRDGDQKLVVLGRQRIKAAALANSKIRQKAEHLRLPALVYRADEEKAFKALIIENEMRVGDPPVMRAEKMQSALERGIGEEEVCRIFKIGKQQLKNMLSLLDCAPEVRTAVNSGVITPSLAYSELVRLDRKEQVATLNTLKESGTTRGSAARDAVSERRNSRAEGREPADPAPRKRAPRRKEIEQMIEKLKGEEQPLFIGVRMGLMKAIGMSPRGWANVTKVLEAEE
jgi:hypothetical protein